MSSEIAVRIEDLAKKYVLNHRDHDHTTLAQAALHRLRHPRGGGSKEEFWALKGVSLEILKGEVLGVIGPNGAGKSTLLKILSRITLPTSGQVQVFGRIGSLLEVGTGFHPELTGRENIYLNGSILGMKKREIDSQFDAIVDFSGVEQFLETPVKRYSSGMYVRLAFAVAAHLRTEILLLDEVLAVGDPDFQQRSVAQIKRLASDGRTVVFVSHNRDLVAELTTTAVALEQGKVVDSGPTAELLERRHVQRRRVAEFLRPPGFGEELALTALEVSAERSLGGLVTVAIRITASASVVACAWRPNFTLHSPTGVPVASSFGPVYQSVVAGSSVRADLVTDPLPLAPGDYSVEIALALQHSENAAFTYVEHVLDAGVLTVPDLQVGMWDPQWGFLNLRTVQAPQREVELQEATSQDASRL